MVTTRRTRQRRASYHDAINWIAENDDNEWLTDPDEDILPSVTASLVADVFFRTIEAVTADLRRALAKLRE